MTASRLKRSILAATAQIVLVAFSVTSVLPVDAASLKDTLSPRKKAGYQESFNRELITAAGLGNNLTPREAVLKARSMLRSQGNQLVSAQPAGKSLGEGKAESRSPSPEVPEIKKQNRTLEPASLRLKKVAFGSLLAGVVFAAACYAGGFDWYVEIKNHVTPGMLFYFPAAALDIAVGVFIWGITDYLGQYLNDDRPIRNKQVMILALAGILQGLLTHVLLNLPDRLPAISPHTLIQGLFRTSVVLVGGLGLTLYHSFSTSAGRKLSGVNIDKIEELKKTGDTMVSKTLLGIVKTYIVINILPSYLRYPVTMAWEYIMHVFASYLMNRVDSVFMPYFARFLPKKYKSAAGKAVQEPAAPSAKNGSQDRVEGKSLGERRWKRFEDEAEFYNEITAQFRSGSKPLLRVKRAAQKDAVFDKGRIVGISDTAVNVRFGGDASAKTVSIEYSGENLKLLQLLVSVPEPPVPSQALVTKARPKVEAPSSVGQDRPRAPPARVPTVMPKSSVSSDKTTALEKTAQKRQFLETARFFLDRLPSDIQRLSGYSSEKEFREYYAANVTMLQWDSLENLTEALGKINKDPNAIQDTAIRHELDLLEARLKKIDQALADLRKRAAKKDKKYAAYVNTSVPSLEKKIQKIKTLTRDILNKSLQDTQRKELGPQDALDELIRNYLLGNRKLLELWESEPFPLNPEAESKQEKMQKIKALLERPLIRQLIMQFESVGYVETIARSSFFISVEKLKTTSPIRMLIQMADRMQKGPGAVSKRQEAREFHENIKNLYAILRALEFSSNYSAVERKERERLRLIVAQSTAPSQKPEAKSLGGEEILRTVDSTRVTSSDAASLPRIGRSLGAKDAADQQPKLPLRRMSKPEYVQKIRCLLDDMSIIAKESSDSFSIDDPKPRELGSLIDQYFSILAKESKGQAFQVPQGVLQTVLDARIYHRLLSRNNTVFLTIRFENKDPSPRDREGYLYKKARFDQPLIVRVSTDPFHKFVGMHLALSCDETRKSQGSSMGEGGEQIQPEDILEMTRLASRYYWGSAPPSSEMSKILRVGGFHAVIPYKNYAVVMSHRRSTDADNILAEKELQAEAYLLRTVNPQGTRRDLPYLIQEIQIKGHSGQQKTYLIMRTFPEGMTFHESDRRDHKWLTRLSEPQKARILLSIARSLQYLANLGSIHRDLQPHNIWIPAELRNDPEKIVEHPPIVFDFSNSIVLNSARDGGAGPYETLYSTIKVEVIGNEDYTYLDENSISDAVSIDIRKDLFGFGTIVQKLYGLRIEDILDQHFESEQKTSDAQEDITRRIGLANNLHPEMKKMLEGLLRLDPLEIPAEWNWDTIVPTLEKIVASDTDPQALTPQNSPPPASSNGASLGKEERNEFSAQTASDSKDAHPSKIVVLGSARRNEGSGYEVITNEDISALLSGLGEVDDRNLSSLTTKQGGFMGIGSFHNLDIALDREAEAIVLVDSSSYVHDVNMRVLRIIEETPDEAFDPEKIASQVLKDAIGDLNNRGVNFYKVINEGDFSDFYKRRTPFRWGKNKEYFLRLKRMIEQGRVAVALADVGDPASMEPIGRFFKERGVSLNVINLSNVEDHLKSLDLDTDSFISALERAGITEKTMIIGSVGERFVNYLRQYEGEKPWVIRPTIDPVDYDAVLESTIGYRKNYGWDHVLRTITDLKKGILLSDHGLTYLRSAIQSQRLPAAGASLGKNKKQKLTAQETNGPKELEEAEKLLSAILVTQSKKDLEYALEAAREITKHPIEKILIVEIRLPYLPALLGLMGKTVLYVDKDPAFVFNMIDEYQSFADEAEAQGVLKPTKIQTVVSEIGELDIAKHQLEMGSFDLVTLVDLVGDGAQIKGEPRKWLETAKKLLKPGGFLLADESMGKDSIAAHLKGVFPGAVLLADGKYFQGSYNSKATNRLYQIAAEGKSLGAETPKRIGLAATPIIGAATLSYFLGDKFVAICSSAVGSFAASLFVAAVSRGSGSYINQILGGKGIDWTIVKRWAVAGLIQPGFFSFFIFYGLLNYFNVSPLMKSVLDVTVFSFVSLPINFLLQNYYVLRDKNPIDPKTFVRNYLKLYVYSTSFWGIGLYFAWSLYPEKVVLIAANLAIVWSGIMIHVLNKWGEQNKEAIKSKTSNSPTASIVIPSEGDEKQGRSLGAREDRPVPKVPGTVYASRFEKRLPPVELRGKMFTPFRIMENGGRVQRIEFFLEGEENRYGFPDIFVYSKSITGAPRDQGLTGIFIRPDAEGKTALRGKGLLRPVLGLFFKEFPYVTKTHPDAENLVLLDVLSRDYGFKPPKGAAPNAYSRKIVDNGRARYQYFVTSAVHHKLMSGDPDEPEKTFLKTLNIGRQEDLSFFRTERTAQPLFIGQELTNDGSFGKMGARLAEGESPSAPLRTGGASLGVSDENLYKAWNNLEQLEVRVSEKFLADLKDSASYSLRMKDYAAIKPEIVKFRDETIPQLKERLREAFDMNKREAAVTSVLEQLKSVRFNSSPFKAQMSEISVTIGTIIYLLGQQSPGIAPAAQKSIATVSPVAKASTEPKKKTPPQKSELYKEEGESETTQEFKTALSAGRFRSDALLQKALYKAARELLGETGADLFKASGILEILIKAYPENRQLKRAATIEIKGIAAIQIIERASSRQSTALPAYFRQAKHFLNKKLSGKVPGTKKVGKSLGVKEIVAFVKENFWALASWTTLIAALAGYIVMSKSESRKPTKTVPNKPEVFKKQPSEQHQEKVSEDKRLAGKSLGEGPQFGIQEYHHEKAQKQGDVFQLSTLLRFENEKAKEVFLRNCDIYFHWGIPGKGAWVFVPAKVEENPLARKLGLILKVEVEPPLSEETVKYRGIFVIVDKKVFTGPTKVEALANPLAQDSIEPASFRWLNPDISFSVAGKSLGRQHGKFRREPDPSYELNRDVIKLIERAKQAMPRGIVPYTSDSFQSSENLLLNAERKITEFLDMAVETKMKFDKYEMITRRLNDVKRELARVFLRRGNAYRRENHFDKAQESYEKAARLYQALLQIPYFAKLPDIHKYLGFSYNESAKVYSIGADAIFRSWQRSEPQDILDNAEKFYRLAREKFVNAKGSLEKALELSQDILSPKDVNELNDNIRIVRDAINQANVDLDDVARERFEAQSLGRSQALGTVLSGSTALTTGVVEGLSLVNKPVPTLSELVRTIMENIRSAPGVMEPAVGRAGSVFCGLLPVSKLKGIDPRQIEFVLSDPLNRIVLVWDVPAQNLAERQAVLEEMGLSKFLAKKNFEYMSGFKDRDETVSLDVQAQKTVSSLLNRGISPDKIAFLKPDGMKGSASVSSLKTSSPHSLLLLHYLVQINGDLRQDLLRIFKREGGDFIAQVSDEIEALFDQYRSLKLTRKAA